MVVIAGFLNHQQYGVEFTPVNMEFLPTKNPSGFYPVGSMYGIFTYIYRRNQPNVGKSAILASYGCRYIPSR